jgi:hypothetical protein
MMQDRAQRTPEPKAAPPPQAAGTRVLQRKCGCGNSSGGGGDCGSCADEKKKKVQRRAIGATTPEIPASVDRVLQSPGRALDHDTRASMESRFGHDFSRVRVHIDTHAASSAHDIQAAAYTSGTHIVFGDRRFEPHTARGRRLLAHELAHVVQQGGGTTIPAGIGAHDDIHERAADHVANAVVAQGAAFAPKPMARANERLIRREREDAAPEEAAEPAQALIVDDSATPAPGQTRRREFVDELDAAICATSSEEMGRLGQSTEGCPLLERWRPRIRAMTSRQLEVSMRRWIGNETVRGARDYIPRITTRLAQSIRIWGATGRIAGVPPDLMDLLAGGTIRIGVGDMIRGAIGSLFRKARGGAAAPADAAPVELSGGQPLAGAVASRMGNAFGRDFSDVRIHTDSASAAEVSRMNARAFTIGSDVAFAAGEYAPGTMIGDALLAHELAHVAQQSGAQGPLKKAAEADGALEHDADDAAVHAIVSLWPAVRRFARGLRQNAGPRLKSGLRLAACGLPRIGSEQMTRTTGSTQDSDVGETGCTAAQRSGPAPGTESQMNPPPRMCCTRTMIAEITRLHPEAIARVQNAFDVLAPDKVSKYDTQLQRNFGFTPSDDVQIQRRIQTIRSNYESILSRMTGGGVKFACRSRYADAQCQHRTPRGGFARFDAAQTGGCSGAEPLIQFCGDYEQSLPPGAVPGSDQNVPAGRWTESQPNVTLRGEPGHPFLYDRGNENPPGSDTDGHNGWVRTLIHEYAHTVCGGSIDAPPAMQRDTEVYQHQIGTFPSANPSTNPDSYAFFAMEVSRLE